MKRVSMPRPEGLKLDEVSEPPKSKAEELKRTAWLLRDRAIYARDLCYDIYERNAKSIHKSFLDDPNSRLTIADMHSIRDYLKLADDTADRADAEARIAEGLPDDPRFTKLGVALVTGDLPTCWRLMHDLAKTVIGHWITVQKGADMEAQITPDMPAGLVEAICEPGETPLDPATVYELRTAQDKSDARAEVIGTGEGMLRLPSGQIVERPPMPKRR